MSPLTMAQALVAEFENECRATRAMLERVPEESLGWRPHEKSMTLGRLASHIAECPGWARRVMSGSELDFAALDYTPPEARSRAELLELFEDERRGFTEALDGVGDEALLEKWVLRSGDHVITRSARVAVLRGFVLSHLIHHRGQLTVYLRLLGVPVPGAYGPTADER
ncbi:MAG: DinB family protein [Thermoanaerobaculia bacterium]|nr:DinB family protein [Thermoanaerobaculia bacterium]